MVPHRFAFDEFVGVVMFEREGVLGFGSFELDFRNIRKRGCHNVILLRTFLKKSRIATGKSDFMQAVCRGGQQFAAIRAHLRFFPLNFLRTSQNAR
jgi:hypothetical protein